MVFSDREKAELARELARLYPHSGDQYRLARAISVRTEFVDMDGNALQVWSAIIHEAAQRDLGYVGQLMAHAVYEYGGAELQRLHELYRQDRAAEGKTDPFLAQRK